MLLYMIKENIKQYFLTVLLGIISGLFGGGLGLGVTTIALPGFILLGLVPNIRTSIGTTLISSPASWPAVYKYYKTGNEDLVKGIIYLICYTISSYYGALINLLLSEKVLNYSVAFVNFLVGLYFLYRARS